MTLTTLHSLYQQLTGLHRGPMQWYDEYVLAGWASHGWGEHELRLVVEHLKREGPKPYPPGSRLPLWQKWCRFDQLIGDPAYFREKLAEALAVQRNAPAPADARTKALAAVGRPTVAPVSDARPVGAIAEEVLKACAEARKIIDGA